MLGCIVLCCVVYCPMVLFSLFYVVLCNFVFLFCCDSLCAGGEIVEAIGGAVDGPRAGRGGTPPPQPPATRWISSDISLAPSWVILVDL